MRTMRTMVLLLVVMWLAAPILTRLVHTLFTPIAVCLALYLLIRLVTAYLNRW